MGIPKLMTPLGLNRLGGGCTGCVGVNGAGHHGGSEKGEVFGPMPPPPPFKGPKCYSGVGVTDCTWAPPPPWEQRWRLFGGLVLGAFGK